MWPTTHVVYLTKVEIQQGKPDVGILRQLPRNERIRAERDGSHRSQAHFSLSQENCRSQEGHLVVKTFKIAIFYLRSSVFFQSNAGWRDKHSQNSLHCDCISLNDSLNDNISTNELIRSVYKANIRQKLCIHIHGYHCEHILLQLSFEMRVFPSFSSS